MKKFLNAALRILIVSAVALLLTKAVRTGMGSLPFLSEMSANNITDIFCALMSCLGGALTEAVRGKKELALQKEKANAEMAQLKEAHKAEIELIEKKSRLAVAEQLLAWERESRLQADSEERERRANLCDVHAKMVFAVTDYLDKHDINYKASAVSSVRCLLAIAGPKLREPLEFLLQVLTSSDPFDGPGKSVCESALNQISIDLFK